jgi:hypothetical protein
VLLGSDRTLSLQCSKWGKPVAAFKQELTFIA